MLKFNAISKYETFIVSAVIYIHCLVFMGLNGLFIKYD